MRKALLFLAIVVCGTAFAQQAQSKVYCEIVGTSKMFSKKLTIEVDFGQESTLFTVKPWWMKTGNRSCSIRWSMR